MVFEPCQVRKHKDLARADQDESAEDTVLRAPIRVCVFLVRRSPDFVRVARRAGAVRWQSGVVQAVGLVNVSCAEHGYVRVCRRSERTCGSDEPRRI